MSTSHPLSIFISSKMKELAEERRVVQATLSDYRMYGWLWEDDAGARPTPTRETFLQEVADCDIYLGLFWLGYGPSTIEEYEYAHKRGTPCLIYKKQVAEDTRDPQLRDFLKRIGDVKNTEGVTTRSFTTVEELATYVQKDVLNLLIHDFRANRQQPAHEVPANKSADRTLSIQEQIELTEKLLKCTAIRDRMQRAAVLGLLPTDITQRITWGNTDLTEVLQIVKTCGEYEGGIEQLARATRTIDGNTRSVQAMIAFLRERSFLV